MRRDWRSAWCVLGGVLALAACSLAPDYQRPQMPIAPDYKEAGGWLLATPALAEADRGPWWQAYGDSTLNALQEQLGSANQDLKASLARYDEARAAAQGARADYFPTLTATAGDMRERRSHTTTNTAQNKLSNDYVLGADLSYELDVWGRVRNAVKAGESRADASAADLAAMDLSLRTELAANYFAMRGEEVTQRIARQTVAAYAKALTVTQVRHAGGVAPALDVDQAQLQLENAKTLMAESALKRAQLEHAIAVLVGQSPSSFRLAENGRVPVVPAITAAMPSRVLQQRPDIAAAELRVQAANAEIGVARAAYFPDFTFSASGGLESAVAASFFTAPSLFWSLGVSAAQPLFDGGRIGALSDAARARYDESVAQYRQSVLTAFQQVEDNLAALRQLGSERHSQDAATAAAKRSLVQAQQRYEGGIATYLDVVQTQNAALQAELASVILRIRMLTAHVLLVKALGGNSVVRSG